MSRCTPQKPAGLGRTRDISQPAPPALPASPSTSLPAFHETTPYWIPAGVDLTEMPDELHGAIACVINPTYQALVLNAEPGLHQSTGLTIVHLLWLEIIDHLDIARVDPDQRINDPLAMFSEQRVDMLARHLRLVHAKMKASELLIRLQEFKGAWRTAADGPVSAKGVEALHSPHFG